MIFFCARGDSAQSVDQSSGGVGHQGLDCAKLRPSSPSALRLMVALALVFAIACGGGDGKNTEPQKILQASGSLSVSDFLAVGFKESKQYDVTGLPGAQSAYYGFWQIGGEPLDFELRFYPGHQEAVAEGLSFAEEVTGRDAAVTSADSTWKEGVRDRRTSGFTLTGGGGALAVKYADFVIYGNVVLLCQGRDSIQSLERCKTLISAVAGS